VIKAAVLGSKYIQCSMLHGSTGRLCSLPIFGICLPVKCKMLMNLLMVLLNVFFHQFDRCIF
jgi:hypothetical protein